MLQELEGMLLGAQEVIAKADVEVQALRASKARLQSENASLQHALMAAADRSLDLETQMRGLVSDCRSYFCCIKNICR